MSLKTIFATGIKHFKNIDLDHKKTLQFLKNLNYTNNYPNLSAMTESIKILDNSEYGKDIKKTFDIYIKKSIKEFGYKTNFEILNSWGTMTKPGTGSHPHKHLNFWLSTVYYPYSNNFNIVFQSERFDLPDFDVPLEHNNPFNGRSFNLIVETGDLIVFPSKLYHSIGFNNTNDIRYSLASNIIPRGYIGSRDSRIFL
jgi:hypothetical protein